jgi:RNA polymerase sigma factor (sigma-70 family)
MSSDEELIGEVLNGNQYAMEILIKRYYKLIFAYVYRSIGDYHEAYDITQEVLIKVVKSIKDYKHEGKFKNWLLRIAANTCNDQFRSSKYRNNKNNAELDCNLVDESSNVYNIMNKKIERQEIKGAITTLPDNQRNAIILKYYHDMKIKDIAAITESNESTVKSRLKQGLEKLKKLFEGSEQFEKNRRSL